MTNIYNGLIKALVQLKSIAVPLSFINYFPLDVFKGARLSSSLTIN